MRRSENTRAAEGGNRKFRIRRIGGTIARPTGLGKWKTVRGCAVEIEAVEQFAWCRLVQFWSYQINFIAN
jgi:hypothetical protein